MSPKELDLLKMKDVESPIYRRTLYGTIWTDYLHKIIYKLHLLVQTESLIRESEMRDVGWRIDPDYVSHIIFALDHLVYVQEKLLRDPSYVNNKYNNNRAKEEE